MRFLFSLAYKDNYGTPSAVFVPAIEDVEYVKGCALLATGAIATGANKPAYICGESKTGVEGEEVTCYRIAPDMVFDTKLTADGASLNVGDKVTLSAAGDGVTATTENGVAEIVDLLGTGVGDYVRVRF